MDDLLLQARHIRESCHIRGWKVAAFMANMLASEIARSLKLDSVERAKLGLSTIEERGEGTDPGCGCVD